MTQSTTLWFLLWVTLYPVNLPAVVSKEVTVKACPLKDLYSMNNRQLIIGAGMNWGTKLGTNWLHTCGTGKKGDFWMTTKYIDLEASFAKVMYVDVEAEFTKCDNPEESTSDNPVVRPCYANYFEVYSYLGPDKEAIRSLNTKNLTDLLTIYSPLYNITNNTAAGLNSTRTHQTFSFSPNNSQGVQFAIRSRGACGSIYRMKIYYYYCEEAFINGIKFERTASPAAGYDRMVKGICTGNTVPYNNGTTLNGNCTHNGTWNVDGNVNCTCVENYTLDQGIGICLPTPVIDRKFNLSPLSPPYGVEITWTKPNNKDGATIFYDVECFICNGNVPVCNISCMNEIYKPGQKNLSETSVTVSNLTAGATYMFKVYATYHLNGKVSEGRWRYVETDRVLVMSGTTTRPPTTQDPSIPADDDDLMYIIIGAVAALLLLILIVLLIICIRRRTKKEVKQKDPGGYVNQGVELPEIAVGQRLYINPSNYDNAQTAVQEFANELDPAMIFLERMIGGGEFGEVYKGVLTTKDNKKVPIAAKTLKHDADAKSERDFHLEASVMAQFDNPNVVHMKGVVTKSIPHMIILEFMSNGSLENYLKNNDDKLTNLQLMGMAKGIADGMKYLAGIQFVHRDLAARNVLLNDELLCKIADFGLSRELEEKDNSRAEYSTKGGKIPVRWTAPEAIKFRKYSTASDVWSYGVLLWEIMSFADRPYWEWDNMKVVEQIEAGFRLPAPQNCPTGVYDLMLQCWKDERRERPSFEKIAAVIEKWIISPETMNDETIPLSPIGKWLASIKMNRYEANFIEAGYKSTSDIRELAGEDLERLGVSLIGHRNKIMKSIKSLKNGKNKQSLRI